MATSVPCCCGNPPRTTGFDSIGWMQISLTDIPAARIALVVAVLALLVVLTLCVRVYRDARRTKRVVSVARLLIDTHLAALEQRTFEAMERGEPLADHTEELAAAVADLTTSLDSLRTLLQAVPSARARARDDVRDFALWLLRPDRPQAPRHDHA